MISPIPFSELEDAFEWVSISPDMGNAAYISKTTGQIFRISEFGDSIDETPADAGNETLYWSVPHQRDLDLGRELVFRFVRARVPEQEYAVRGIFKKRGAYSRFKDVLLRCDRMDEWHEYRQREMELALRDWAESMGLPLSPGKPGG
jgi:hypothetical protein